MIFKSIILENFRPYYGKIKIEFCSGEKNITLLKAENGSGKTTLLEAIRWGLYGGNLDLTSGDPKNFGAASFVNKKYLEENRKVCSAKVVLNIIGKVSEDSIEQEYKITREVSFENDMFKGIRVSIESRDGKTTGDISEIHCQEIINRLLPKEINFFVDGERLNKISPEKDTKKSIQKENAQVIRESINRILGIKSLENAILDTSKVFNQLEKDYYESSQSNKDIVKLQEKINELENKKNIKLNEKFEKEREIESLDEQKEEINNQIDDILQVIKEDEKNKERVNFLENEEQKLIKLIDEKKKMYDLFLSVKGVEIISSKILKNGFKIIEEKKAKGEIPSRYEKEFLEELIGLKECICGASLASHTENYIKIMEKLESAASKESREKVSEVYFMLKNTDKRNFLQDVNSIKMELYKTEDRITHLQDELNILVKDVNKDLLNKLQKLKEGLVKKDEEKNILNRSIGSLEIELEEIEKKLNSVRIEKIEADKKNIKSIKERINRDFAERILLSLETLKKHKEAQGREGLMLKIEEVYSKINKKGYKAELTENFEFKVFDTDGKEAGTSGGEGKNKALGFIGGLVYYAKELNREKNKSALDFNGGIYPLVLDSPYGDLDSEYRVDVTKMLPVLSEQVIVMVSSGQWNDSMENVVKNNIGKKYVLENQRRVGSDKRFDVTIVREEI
ncbi:MAG: AAA family ATPase [Clostridium sp.]|uniref:AAA family ATPase n=1 Tax=Clostridium sp. TaxID=1506 RepID=UPI003EE7B2DF